MAGPAEHRGFEADGRRPMRADARRNHERLLQAAREVFAEQGDQASMEAVARQAGVGVGTLYRHFPQRIDLVEAVYQDDVEALVGAAEKAATESDPWVGLEGWLRAYVAYARAKRAFLSELHEAFEKNPDLKSASRARIEQACSSVLVRAQEGGAARRDIDGSDLMQIVSPMCMSPTLTPEQGQRLLMMILDGLRPPR